MIAFPRQTFAFGRGEVGEYGFTGNGTLANGNQRIRSLGQIYIDTAAETDKAKPLARARRSPSLTNFTMRRAINPAICTTPSLPPS